ncbi:hypothetical protein N7491_003388 [Penicillium cf. griseofulvum]|uniref:PH domain-containing protein n=1 Tax=Penicillium cf. griseofulvum TaxID=2972120 RepID=A0A9W9MR83_9EURO|nr:hypothetical protein N7472_002437 [Penicillium cf. griseofulvum]KAJ5440982.1 hypothetical protein N7491_003388 [Penicillium cf. griseofulvum]
MSEVQKIVEETPTVVPAVETAVETPAEAVEAPKETSEEPTATPAVESTETAEPAKEEVKPATDGVLGYKAPGLVKGFRFAKRFFYFNEEAVESKNLSIFHQNEKAAVANPTAAWATQTGKGLLFFTKRAEDKATPAGILNLADVSDVTKEGTSEFLFKIAGHKHTFQASSAAERDSWVVAIEAQATEAKAEKETITSSEGYKAELEKLTKPAVVVAAKKPEEKKVEDKKEETPVVAAEAAQEEPKEEKKEEKTASKSRSQSRKRTSIFGSLLGKKDAEEKKEETPVAEESKAVESTAEPSVEAAAPAVAETTETAAPAEVVEATAETPAETTEAAKEEAKDEKKAEKKAKRTSIFGNFFQKVASPSQEKSEKEATVAPAVEETPVASTAPQLENPVEEAAVKPIEPEAVTAAAEAVETPAAETPAETVSTPKEKRRTSFFGNLGMKKEKKADSDNEVTDGETKAKSNKLGGLFRKPSKAVKLDKEEVAAAETEAKADAAEEAPAVPAKETATEEAPAVVEETPKAVETAQDPKNVNVAVATPVQATA